MTISPKFYNALLLTTSVSLIGCQTTEIVPPKTMPYSENIVVSTPGIDSDGDSVLNNMDECLETPPHRVVDAKGCEIIIEGGDALEMEFVGFFPPMSSQLPTIYNTEFVKVAEKLNEYPKASAFIFGHASSNKINESSLATFGSDSLARNRALIIKDTLVLQHNVDAKRIRTYNCSNKLLVKDNAYIDSSFKALNLKNLESKQRRATLMASSAVHDLMNLEYDSNIQKYGKYAKH